MSYTTSEIAAMLGCALVNAFILACIVGIGYALYLAMTVKIPAW
jgi:hypothetical protein